MEQNAETKIKELQSLIKDYQQKLAEVNSILKDYQKLKELSDRIKVVQFEHKCVSIPYGLTQLEQDEFIQRNIAQNLAKELIDRNLIIYSFEAEPILPSFEPEHYGRHQFVIKSKMYMVTPIKK